MNELPCSAKTVYSNRAEAQAAATTLLHRHGEKLTVYHCDHCDQWHLSTAN